MFTGIKSVIYPSNDLAGDTAMWTKITGEEPYFNESYYVGFKISECELGLDPNAGKQGITYPIAYQHVADVTDTTEKILASGAQQNTKAVDVGGGILMATFLDANGSIFGIIDQKRPSMTFKKMRNHAEYVSGT